MRLFAPVTLCLFLACAGQLFAQQKQEKKIELVPIKMKDLLKHIESQKGKVVVVNLWAAYNAPAINEFPNFVRLHETYGEKGLACLSLSADPNENYRKNALKFLQEKKALFKNYYIEDLIELQKHWNTDAPHLTVVVYGRDGKLVMLFDRASEEEWTYKDVEKLVKKLVDAK